jgi:hypothetical protein
VEENNIILKEIIKGIELENRLKKIFYRGVFNEKGEQVKPYEKATFSLVAIHPPKTITSSPKVMHNLQSQRLFTAQPTIYVNQVKITAQIDKFLQKHEKRINDLKFEAIGYDWEGRGSFHVMPPLIEKHVYPLTKGSIDLKKLAQRFKGYYTKDYKGNLHDLSKRYLNNFYIDEVSKIKQIDIFYHNTPLINYGLKYSGNAEFYIVCDGSHRIDYSFEHLDQQTTAVLVESDPPLLPYYALPMPFRPSLRLSSKAAEKMFPRLDRDKIHLFNDFIKKSLHYNWDETNLNVSKLRSNI